MLRRSSRRRCHRWLDEVAEALRRSDDKSIPKSAVPVGPWVLPRCATGWLWVRCTPDWKTGPAISIGSPTTSPNVHAAASVIITGGYAPNRAVAAVRLRTRHFGADSTAESPGAVHDSGAKRSCCKSAPDATPTTHLRSAPRRSRRRSPRFVREHYRLAGSTTIADFARCAVGPRCRLTASNHGQRRGYLLNPVPGAAHQQAHRSWGAPVTVAGSRSRSSDAAAPCVGTDHHLLPAVNGRLRCRRPELG